LQFGSEEINTNGKGRSKKEESKKEESKKEARRKRAELKINCCQAGAQRCCAPTFTGVGS
jgi:hypothetical protein